MRRLLPGLLLSLVVAAPAAGQFTAFQGGPLHTGAVDAQLAPPLGKRWVVGGLGYLSTPIVADGVVLVTAGSTLRAFDAKTGADRWRVDGVSGRLSASRGQVYSRDGERVVARDIQTGDVRWSVGGGDSFSGTEPVADGDLVFTGGENPAAYDAGTGLQLWAVGSSGSNTGAPAADGSRVYLDSCGTLSARERTTGLRMWTAAADDCSGRPAPPVVSGDRVFGASQVVDALTGLNPAPKAPGLPAIRDGITVTAAGDYDSDPGTLTARDGEGRTVWEIGGTSLAFSSLPLIVGETVFIRTGDDRLRGYDFATGAETFSSSSRVDDSYGYGYGSTSGQSEGLAAAGDMLFVPYRGKLVAYGPGADTPGVDPDPWTMPSAVRLSLAKPVPNEVPAGRRTHLTATYTRQVGEDPDGATVRLEADPFPFDGQWTDAGKIDLTYGRNVRPERNTRYRARYDGVIPAKVTRPRTVYAKLGFRVAYTFLSRTRLRAHPVLRGPADGVRGRKVAFYFYRRAANRSRRLRVVRVGRTVVLPFPASAGRRDYVFGCVIERHDDGFGRYKRSYARCGNR